MKAKQAKERLCAEERRWRKEQKKSLGLGFLGLEEAAKEERFLGSSAAPALL